jgi:hypothetical protein
MYEHAHAHVGNIGKWKTHGDGDMDIQVFVFPSPGAFHHVSWYPLVRAAIHRSECNIRSSNFDGRVVLSANGSNQQARRSLPHQVEIVVWEALDDEYDVGVFREFFVFIGVQIQGYGYRDITEFGFNSAHQFRFRPGDALHGHCPVQWQVYGIEIGYSGQSIDHF